MSINVNKYNKRSDYLTDNNRPANECCVSQVDSNVAYDAVNVMLKGDQLRHDLVCVVAKDNVSGELFYIPVETYRPAKLDTERYTVQDFIFYGIEAGKKMWMHKNNSGDAVWGERNFYKITPDTTAAGGFTWAVGVNGAAKGGTVEWAANDSIDSIVAQMSGQAVDYFLEISHVEGEAFIRVKHGGWEYSVLTISSVTGATLTDLSIYIKVGGVQQTEEHREWQAQDVASMFPSSGILPANTVQYAKNGYDLKYACGGNLARFKAYHHDNGNAGFAADSAVDVMRKSAFDGCADGTIGGADGIALYNKYHGSWDEYMAARMINLDDTHRDGVEFKAYDNGVEQNAFLASVTTMDFDGSYIPAFPAAYLVSQTKINGHDGALPGNHEIGVFIEDAQLALVNQALNAIGGTPLSNTGYYWAVSQHYSTNAWLYNVYTGCIGSNVKYYTLTCRAVLASL